MYVHARVYVFVDIWEMLDTTVLSFPGNLPAHSHFWVAITTAAAISVTAVGHSYQMGEGVPARGGFIHPL